MIPLFFRPLTVSQFSGHGFIAYRMLTGDRGKYLGLVFAIAFATLLLAHQGSMFCGIMARTTSQITDVADADIWVMDPATEYIDEVRPLRDTELLRVRGVPGVAWAVPFLKSLPVARSAEGRFRQVILLGLDDATLAGAPQRMVLGDVGSLREPDGVIIDRAGYRAFFPEGPLEPGRVLEMNDRTARIVGISEASPPFQTFPVLFARAGTAATYAGQERNTLSFVLVRAVAGEDPAVLCRSIADRTGLRAMTTAGFAASTRGYYLANTGIPANFGLTIAIALVVGTVVAGQTFYLFTVENLRQFAALKAIGVTDRGIVSMVLQQAAVVGVVGYSFGIALCAFLFELSQDVMQLRGFIVYWQVAAGTGVAMVAIAVVASLLSIRRVLVTEPALVFRV
jgi:putative ABC transport system permease protein